MHLSRTLLACLLAPAACQDPPARLWWTGNTSLALSLPGAGGPDRIELVPSSPVPGLTVPCLWSGALLGEPGAVVAVSGCQDRPQEATLVTMASDRLEGGLISLSLLGNVTTVLGELPVPGGAVDRADRRKRAAKLSLPKTVVLETALMYDETLLNRHNHNEFKTSVWIAKIVELSRPRLSHHSLDVGVILEIIGSIGHLHWNVKADDMSKDHLRKWMQEERKSHIVSVFSFDASNDLCGVHGNQAAACSTDGDQFVVSEMSGGSNPEHFASKAFVHELGHLLGMYHDSDPRHAGEGCEGTGLMGGWNAPDAWSVCSNRDFLDFWQTGGDACLKEPAPTTAPPTEMTSQNYPGNYPDNWVRTQDIIVPEGRRIKVEFTHFDLEQDDYCDYDYVEIKEADSSLLGERLCGNTIPGILVSRTSRLLVLLHTDRSVNMPGFRLLWTVL